MRFVFVLVLLFLAGCASTSKKAKDSDEISDYRKWSSVVTRVSLLSVKHAKVVDQYGTLKKQDRVRQKYFLTEASGKPYRYGLEKKMVHPSSASNMGGFKPGGLEVVTDIVPTSISAKTWSPSKPLQHFNRFSESDVEFFVGLCDVLGIRGSDFTITVVANVEPYIASFDGQLSGTADERSDTLLKNMTPDYGAFQILKYRMPKWCQDSFQVIAQPEVAPIATSLTDDGRALNRRADIIISELPFSEIVAHVESRHNHPYYQFHRDLDEEAVKTRLLIAKKQRERSLKDKPIKPKERLAGANGKKPTMDKKNVSSFELMLGAAGQQQFPMTAPNLLFGGGSLKRHALDVIELASVKNEPAGFWSSGVAYADFGSCSLLHGVEHEKDKWYQIDWSSDDYKVSDYLKNMHRTVLYARVGNHGVSMSPLSVTKGYEVDKAPVISIHRDFYKGGKNVISTSQETKVYLYKGEKALVYRVFVEDRAHPVSCIDLVIDEKLGAVSDGRMYYLYKGRLKAVKIAPKVM
ncbi:hypothetical protein [Vibrio barjaei]|uniref:hypothetical protein n=1 Tax=Vibrio barjaei TaxID=1676683 RepID=UPI0022853364|nr:hypothetical protein [Vibrio barjaei]MCY9873003.1 hypothetical protein [Vibrio barjaei]